MTGCHSKGHCTLSNTLQPEVLPVRKMLMPLLYKMVYLLYKYWQGNYIGGLAILETHKNESFYVILFMLINGTWLQYQWLYSTKFSWAANFRRPPF